jgi:hypothetical protein
VFASCQRGVVMTRHAPIEIAALYREAIWSSRQAPPISSSYQAAAGRLGAFMRGLVGTPVLVIQPRRGRLLYWGMYLRPIRNTHTNTVEQTWALRPQRPGQARLFTRQPTGLPGLYRPGGELRRDAVGACSLVVRCVAGKFRRGTGKIAQTPHDITQCHCMPAHIPGRTAA